LAAPLVLHLDHFVETDFGVREARRHSGSETTLKPETTRSMRPSGLLGLTNIEARSLPIISL
jgi:hypothetical protein